MSIRIKQRSQKKYDSIPLMANHISVGALKSKIVEHMKWARGGGAIDLLLFDEQNNEFADDKALIPRSTTVIFKKRPQTSNTQTVYMPSMAAKPTA